MNKFIRKMCLALSLVLCVSLAATSVFAAEPETREGETSRMVTVTYKQMIVDENTGDMEDKILGSEQIEIEYGVMYIVPADLSHIPEGYKLLGSNGIRIRDTQTAISVYVVVDPANPPKPTEPEVTEPEIEDNSRMVTVTYMRLIEDDEGELVDEVLGTEQVEVQYGAEYISLDQLSHIPEGYKLLSPLGVKIDDSRNEAWAYVAKDPANPPKPTEPEVTEPETTEPEETVPETEPDVTVPETKPDVTVPETKPNETTPATKPTETKPNAEKDDVPKTGDESHLVVWTSAAAISLIGVGAVVVTMKKKETR